MLTNSEKDILRELAKKQKEYASLDIMEKRKKRWYNANDLKGGAPLINMEMWTFAKELERPFCCESKWGRIIEKNIMDKIIAHEDINDDRVIDGDFYIYNKISFKPFGLDRKIEKPREDSVGFHSVEVIKDLEEDFNKLLKSTWEINLSYTDEYKKIVEDTLGDILDIKVFTPQPYFVPTNWILQFMSMENFLISMYDYPELVHKMMENISNDYNEFLDELETKGLLTVNNLNQALNQGSWAFTNDLKNVECVKINNLWGYMDSQETVGISPDMFGEFINKYLFMVGERFGLLNYGCCEPVDAFWGYIKKHKNLRKVSISPWCNEEFMANELKGKNIIYHRKPSPNYISTPNAFDEEGFKKHIIKTIKTAEGCHLEFSFRDIYTLGGDKTRAKRAVDIVRNLCC